MCLFIILKEHSLHLLDNKTGQVDLDLSVKQLYKSETEVICFSVSLLLRYDHLMDHINVKLIERRHLSLKDTTMLKKIRIT